MKEEKTVAKVTEQVQYGEHTLILETGEIARQADGAVLVSMAGTQVLVTVVAKKDGAEANDFFPLTVHYQERSYAAGKIPGGFNKREGRPSEIETLASRLIDRPIRPLFSAGFHNEVQILATVLSLNPEVSADILAMIGASAALAVSGIPILAPIGAARVGYQDGVYLLNPCSKTLSSSALDLVVAGTKDAILMVESQAKELSEEVMLGAVLFGHEMMKGVIHAIEALAKKVDKEGWAWTPAEENEALKTRIETMNKEAFEAAYLIKNKQARYKQLNEIRKNAVDTLLPEFPTETGRTLMNKLGILEEHIVRSRILAGEPRIDGRDCKTVRPIVIRTGILDRTHGSALFTRGETQALVTVTLGSERDAQTLDNLDGATKDRFMLHYNFPPYSVGETGMVGTPKRREIGHGRLARRSLMAVLPDLNEFPYVLRIVSEITESNGSSSMASVCGSSLALMDAGVRIKAPVAGVAMGLIKEGNQFAILTDILGDEDHLGDMDFKVAGTTAGITALQMDIKITGITKEILSESLAQALEGRKHILEVMDAAISTARTTMSAHAPKIESFTVPEDKIRTIIGKGGATIKSITESTGVSVDIDDSGTVQLFSPNAEALDEAKRQIKQLIAEIEVGKTYKGKVTKIVDFGAFINLLPSKDGLLHISQICEDRNHKVESVLQEGQEIEVFVAGLDKAGRVKLEWKDKPVKQEETAPIEVESEASSQGEDA